MYDAINKGLARTTGEILAYLNSDDACFPMGRETVVAAFEAHRDADLVYGDGIKVDEANGSQRLRILPPFHRISVANYESVCQRAVFWRRRLYERMGGFDDSMRLRRRPRLLAPRVRVRRADRARERGDRDRADPPGSAVEHARDSDGGRGPRDVPATRATAGARGAASGPSTVKAWQRWLWPRFMTAFALRPTGPVMAPIPPPGHVSVRGRRILAGRGPRTAIGCGAPCRHRWLPRSSGWPSRSGRVPT